jgi:Domain of unknown function (DUF3427)/Helicase conserved C-terminal domain
MRALGFCVSVGHARFMAARFTAAGVPALAVSGDSSRAEREHALRALRAGDVRILFAVDLFNEGLDVPDVDTLLLLRPTQSVTVFLQQLGRGLRRTPTKPVLTVLDLVGQQNRHFRFDLRYRALTGSTRAGLIRQLGEGFSYLPSGCEIVLDAVARRIVLENVKRQLRLSRGELVEDIRSHGDLDLRSWLRESGRELTDVYRAQRSWTDLRRQAGWPTADSGPREEQLLRRMQAFAHVDDPERAEIYRRLVTNHVTLAELNDREQRFARMLWFSLWPDCGGLRGYQEGFDLLWEHPAVRDELRQLLTVSIESTEHVARPLLNGPAGCTLSTHAHYSREEVLAALDYADLEHKPSVFVAGVVWSPKMNADAFFVTLRKTERDYSPTTMYRDYALSPELFHWESQNATDIGSPTGQRYLGHKEQGSHVLLLTRQNRRNSWGGPQPFFCLGTADYVSHSSTRPIAITWHLRRPIPQDEFRIASVVA